MPVIAVLEPLEVEDLYLILKNPNSPLISSKKKDFRAYGIEVVFEDEALWRIAEKAYAQKTGARGLVSIIENVLLKYERKLPSTPIRHLVVTKEMVDDPEGELEKLLKDPNDPSYLEQFERALLKEKEEIRGYILSRKEEFQENYEPLFEGERVDLLAERLLSREEDLNGALEDLWICYKQIRAFERSFRDRYGVEISFDQGAVDYLLKALFAEGKSPREVFLYLEGVYEPAIRLLLERGAPRRFVIPREGVEDPEGYFNDLVRKLYHPSYGRS